MKQEGSSVLFSKNQLHSRSCCSLIFFRLNNNYQLEEEKTAPYRMAILFSFNYKPDLSYTLREEEKQAFSYGAARSSSFKDYLNP
jgi:hypothetical protein